MAMWMRDEDHSDQLDRLSQMIALPLSKEMSNCQLSSTELAAEYRIGSQMVVENRLLAGVELVEIPGISALNLDALTLDLQEIRSAEAFGLSLSWDLWWIPLDRLEIVRSVWFQ
jgi:hypothetical protein